jgi:hypothetical protein
MTPLAQALAKQLLMQPKDRHPFWRVEKNSKLLRSVLDDVHCFEVTQTKPLAKELYESLQGVTPEQRMELFKTFTFLPAPKTWIEYREDGTRLGNFIGDCGDGRALMITFADDYFCISGEIGINTGVIYTGPPKSRTPEQIAAHLTPTEIENLDKQMLLLITLDLIIINTPRIIGRRQHIPHAGLEKNLAKGFGVGKFPLHAWTEILLQVSKPTEIDDGEPHEAHLTGKRALHFCRKHIRIRLGQLEYVSAHWRGDPAIGIKRSRYTVPP